MLAGYFLKVMELLLEKRQLAVLDYVFNFREHMLNVIKHSYDKSVAEVLKKIVSNEDRYLTGTTGEEFLYEKMEVIDQLIDQLDPVNTQQTITNSSSILSGLIESRQHLSYFNDPRVLKRIFIAIATSKPASVCAGITYLATLLRLNMTSAAASAANTEQFCFIGRDTLQRIV